MLDFFAKQINNGVDEGRNWLFGVRLSDNYQEWIPEQYTMELRI